MYRCEATTIAGLVQQVAVAYVQHGYWFYVPGRVPADKTPDAIDAKLIDLYEIDVSRWVRHRRKLRGAANVQYIRFERFFFLLATKGEHAFFAREKAVLRDVRRQPIRFAGYSISYKVDRNGKGHASVRIAPPEYRRLKQRAEELARLRAPEAVESWIRGLRFEPYAPIRRQLHGLVRAANRVRSDLKLEAVSCECVRHRRRIVEPFADVA